MVLYAIFVVISVISLVIPVISVISVNRHTGHIESSVTPGVVTYSVAIQINHSSTNTQNRTTEPNGPRPPNTSQSAQNEPRPSNNTTPKVSLTVTRVRCVLGIKKRW